MPASVLPAPVVVARSESGASYTTVPAVTCLKHKYASGFNFWTKLRVTLNVRQPGSPQVRWGS